MSIEETKSNDYKLIFGGIFLGVTSLIIIVCLFIFMSNCDNDYCTISDSVQDEIIKARTAIGISGGLLFLFGVLHVSARTEKMKKIVKSNTFSGAWANALFPVLSLTLLVSSIYLYTIVNEANFVCIDDTGSTKSKRNSRYNSITTPINIMIGMSVLLLISSIIVLYNFWKKTDEEKLADAEKAKASLSKIDDKVIGEAPVSLHKKLDEIELSLSQAKGLYDDELDNAQVENLIESVKLKKNALNNAVSRKKADLESEKAKLQEVLSSQTNTIKRQRDNDIAIHDFNAKSDTDKFTYFCNIKKENNNPELLKKLQDTDFYKQKSKELEEVCASGGDIAIIKARDRLIIEWDGLTTDKDRINFLDQLCSKENQKGLGKMVLEKLQKDQSINMARTGVKEFDYNKTCSLPGQDGTILNLVKNRGIRGPGISINSGPPLEVLDRRTHVVDEPVFIKNQPERERQIESQQKNVVIEQPVDPIPNQEREKQIEQGGIDAIQKFQYCEDITRGLKFKDVHDKYKTLCNKLSSPKNEITDNQILECFKEKGFVYDVNLNHFRDNCKKSEQVLNTREQRDRYFKEHPQPPPNKFKPNLTKRLLKKTLNKH